MNGATTVPDGRQVIPTSAWVLAWSFVVGQVLELVQRGPQEESAWPLSILLAVVLVPLLALAVVVGVLGGVLGAESADPQLTVHLDV